PGRPTPRGPRRSRPGSAPFRAAPPAPFRPRPPGSARVPYNVSEAERELNERFRTGSGILADTASMLNWMTYDFGYSWPFTRGHFVVFLLFGAVAAISLWRGWPRWLTVLTSFLVVWGLAGALVMHYAIQINSPVTMPTER